VRCPLLLCSSLVSLLFLLFFFFSCGCDFFSHYFISRFFFLASLSERDHTQTKIHAKKKLLLSKRHKNKKRSLCLSIRARAGREPGTPRSASEEEEEENSLSLSFQNIIRIEYILLKSRLFFLNFLLSRIS